MPKYPVPRSTSTTPRNYPLNNIPPDVYKFIQEEQSKIKIAKGVNQYSFAATIYKMLRDYKRCQEENKNFKPTHD